MSTPVTVNLTDDKPICLLCQCSIQVCPVDSSSSASAQSAPRSEHGRSEAPLGLHSSTAPDADGKGEGIAEGLRASLLAELESCCRSPSTPPTPSRATRESAATTGEIAAVAPDSGTLLELICASGSPLDLPMCRRCANQVAAELQRQMAELETECRSYESALTDLMAAKRDQRWFNGEQARDKLRSLDAEECDLTEQLAALEVEEKALAEELESRLHERKNLADRDEELYRQLRDNHRTLIGEAEEQRSLKAQIKYANEQLQRLQRINPLDMAFFIWIDGEYGTINGLRLGRLRQEVEWAEINAALGQIALLLNVLAQKLGMQFADYQIEPCGSTSTVRCHRTPAGASKSAAEELPLYGTGGWRPFGQPQLDQALAAYLDCFCQLETNLRGRFPSATQVLPYRMLRDGKVVDKDSQYGVKMQLNSEERWTKAMKCVLLNLKRAIAIILNLRPAQQKINVGEPMSTSTSASKE